MSSEFSVHIINPRGRKKASRRKKSTKKVAKAKKASTMAKAKKATRRRRRKSTAVAVRASATPRRRRRRNPANPKRRRRRNPLGYGSGTIMGEVKRFFPSLAGKLAVAWAVRRWGGDGSLMGGMRTSQTAGESWSLGQYLVAGIVAQYGGKIFGKFLNGAEFKRGAWDLILTKLVWTEGISRSDWAVKQFGQAEGAVGWDMMTGQSYINQGGSQNAMQGLVGKSALDGIVEASPLDGGVNYGYGHILDTSTSAATRRAGKYHGVGHTSAYQAAFTR